MSGNGWFQWIVHIEILRWAACWKRPSVVRQSSGNFHLCQHLEHIKSHHYEFPCYIYNLLIIDCCLMPPTPTVALMAFEQSFSLIGPQTLAFLICCQEIGCMGSLPTVMISLLYRYNLCPMGHMAHLGNVSMQWSSLSNTMIMHARLLKVASIPPWHGSYLNRLKFPSPRMPSGSEEEGLYTSSMTFKDLPQNHWVNFIISLIFSLCRYHLPLKKVTILHLVKL